MGQGFSVIICSLPDWLELMVVEHYFHSELIQNLVTWHNNNKTDISMHIVYVLKKIDKDINVCQNCLATLYLFCAIFDLEQKIRNVLVWLLFSSFLQKKNELNHNRSEVS